MSEIAKKDRLANIERTGNRANQGPQGWNLAKFFGPEQTYDRVSAMFGRLRGLLGNWSTREHLRARLSRVERPEIEQATLRVAIVGLVLVYLVFAANIDGRIDRHELEVVWVAIGTVAFGLVLVVRIIAVGGASVTRRLLGMLADNAVTTYCMIQMEEAGAIIIGVYLFVTFGNGFRYGRAYLHASQALSIAGFCTVVALSDYWRSNLTLSFGLLLASIVLPFYVGVLAERITEARRKADEANQAKGRFLANMSHEMRTPLNGVIAMADVLRETQLSQSQQEIVETMTTSAHLLLAQIEDVLDMAKIEAGRVSIENRPFEPSRMIPATVKVIIPQARFKGLAVNVEISPELSGWFLGDAHHLRQVVLNLLANAVKFTDHGEVSLQASTAGDANHPRMRIEIRDTGVGISAAKQSQIFEPFTQADDSITRVYGGTGLGTTIARQLVMLMGGSIGLESTVGVGSLFWIELPLIPTEPQGLDLSEEFSQPARSATAVHALAASHQATVYKLRGARILVAEDNPTNQRVAQLILESGGHNVTVVENGERALDLLERGSYDLALFDLSMPLVSGIEALKLYRFTTPDPIPVLILSANVTTEAIDECHRAGAAEFMPKPLRASLLLDAVERHLSVERVSSIPRSAPFTGERPSLTVVDVPVFDPQVLEDLSRLSPDPTFVERLLRGFRSDTERLQKQILDAFLQRKYELVKDAAHALKGGGSSVGATQLTQLATRFEKASHDVLRIKSAQLIEELNAIVSRTFGCLDDYLSRPDSDRSWPAS